jgi:hypothetical protein
MTLTQSTGLIMPKPLVGAKGGKLWLNDTLYPAGYVPVNPSRGLLQPGAPFDDATVTQPDALDDEMYESGEVAAVAVPHFPKEAARFIFVDDPSSGSVTGSGAGSGPGSPMVSYTMNNPRYAQVMLPDPLDDTSIGLPEGDNEMFSVSASDERHWSTALSPGEATKTGTASHEVDQWLNDRDLSMSGATGIWSIAGRT